MRFFMKLSTKSRYGLRILLEIALDRDGNGASSGKTIAQKQDISEAYLEQIMIPLKEAGLIRTIRGCRGGYALRRPASEITMLDVMELFEGPLDLVKCGEGDKPCSRLAECTTSKVWKHLSETLRREAKKITLAQIVKNSRENNRPEYII